MSSRKLICDTALDWEIRDVERNREPAMGGPHRNPSCDGVVELDITRMIGVVEEDERETDSMVGEC